MILLLGGTSETSQTAIAFASAGQRVLVSKATDIELQIPADEMISVRTGLLDNEQMTELIKTEGIAAVVDVTHPFAEQVTETARQVCEKTEMPYYRFERPRLEYSGDNIHHCQTHHQAAEKACQFDLSVLLTIGTRNISPYVTAAKEKQVKLFARVLDKQSSIAKCLEAGLERENVIAAKGPFTVADNIETLRKYQIGVLVTKDSGDAGGVPAKLETAKAENCQVILIDRPTSCEKSYACLKELTAAVLATM